MPPATGSRTGTAALNTLRTCVGPASIVVSAASMHGTMALSFERILPMTHLVRALTLMALLTAGSAAAGPLTITGAWVRATPPGARTAAAYLTIANDGAADTLLGAATPSARTVEVHTHVAEGGLQRMVELKELTLPPAQAVVLEPGGQHLMLIDLAGPLAAGTNVALSLRFAAAGTIELQVPVVDARSGAPPQHGAH
jgi:copper(I)-binding protein